MAFLFTNGKMCATGVDPKAGTSVNLQACAHAVMDDCVTVLVHPADMSSEKPLARIITRTKAQPQTRPGFLVFLCGISKETSG
jgi:hypothetical protein